MPALVPIPTDALPRVVRMGVNRRRDEMVFARHVVDVYVLNCLIGANARCTLDDRPCDLPDGSVHVACQGDVMSGAGTDADGAVWRWVGFTLPGDRTFLAMPRLIALPPDDRRTYAETFDALFEDFAGGSDGWELRSASHLLRLLDILRGAAAHDGGDPGPAEQKAQLAVRYIERHARRRLLVRDVAGAVGLNVSYLTRIFRQHTGTTPMQYLMRVRLREARRLLIEEPGLAVREVCFRAGFEDPGHFARAFRRRYQATPSGIRLRMLAQPASSA